MNVTVEFVSPLNGIASVDRASVTLPEGCTLAKLVSALREQFPDLFPAADRALFVVNTTLARPDTVLRDGERVLMMQVVGGG